MRLVCPCCGAVCSAEAWVNDPTAREALKVIAEELPAGVAPLALPYLSLFRKSGAGLRWPTVLKRLQELADLVRSERIQWDGGETRPAPAHLWAAALDVVVGRQPKHLDNHNYLRRVVWEMAAGGAAAAEREAERAKSWRGPEPGEIPSGPPLLKGGEDEPPMTPAEAKAFAARFQELVEKKTFK